MDGSQDGTTVGKSDGTLDGTLYDPEAAVEYLDFEELDESDENNVDEQEAANPLHDASDYVFLFTGIFFQRFYKSQLRPKEWTKTAVYGDTATEVVDCLWGIAFAKVERQVIFDDETPRWSENTTPTVNDASDFITLQDTTKKKLYAIDSLTARVLRGWKGKTVRVYIYTFGRPMYKPVLNIKQYSVSYSHHKTRIGLGPIHSWLLWANFIHSAPVHTQDQMKQSSTPPMQLSKYFRWVATSEPSRLEAVHKGMIVAQNNNSGWLREIGNVKKTLLDCKKLLDGALLKVEEMEQRGVIGNDMLNSMELAVRPEEMELSQHLANSVTDCDDVDHQ
ncbi:hypothetical protein RP20_CCG025236 [Aedes albopictus]|nr:hypothetical protein RP20_CCG025236 [Aedes albopictus]